jgi:ubiquinone/menaquinone biosynthesis C-methylase UbiE
MTTTDQSQHDGAFNHNVAWQHQGVADAYDKRRFTSLGGRLYDSMEKKALLRMLGEMGARAQVRDMLEMACGTGRISELLASQGYTLTCGDISKEMQQVARQRLAAKGLGQARFEIQDIYQISHPADSFDCVCAFRLFQHLDSAERAKALREMARVSRRFVLLNVMYTSAYYGLVRRLRQALRRYTTRYTSSDAEIRSELQFAGLRMIASVLSQPGFNGNRVLLLEKDPSAR